MSEPSPNLSSPHDAWIVFFAKSIRTLCYGFMGVLVPVVLTQMGFTKKELGYTFSLTLAASAFITIVSTRLARRFGLRSLLIALHGITVLSAALFLAGTKPWVYVVAAMVGNLALGVGETGPFLALEQVVLARSVPTEKLTGFLSLYNLTGFICPAIGGVLVGWLGNRPHWLFWIFLLSGAVQSLLYVFSHPTPALPPKVAGEREPSRPLIRKIAALFALDAFGGGFILQSWVMYWFYIRFHLDLPSLGWIYFLLQMTTGLSLLAAAPLTKKWGLVNTMVFSHLISNLFLIAIPLAPTAAVAVLILFGRHLLSQIDVPTRQAFLLLAVRDHEKEQASGLTTTWRTVSQAVSPTIGGWAMQGLFLSAPFLFGGGLKIVYDFFLYRLARRVTLEEAGRVS